MNNKKRERTDPEKKKKRRRFSTSRERKQNDDCIDIDEIAQEIIVEMVFQLGKNGVSKFRNMWKALAEKNYIGASYEMLDSRWAKQTPNRAKAMAKTMKEIT